MDESALQKLHEEHEANAQLEAEQQPFTLKLAHELATGFFQMYITNPDNYGQTQLREEMLQAIEEVDKATTLEEIKLVMDPYKDILEMKSKEKFSNGPNHLSLLFDRLY